MRNVRARIAYDGSRFYGWQRQDGFPSVQQALEQALEALLGAAIAVHGAGRTDTGVHALGQVASFHVDTRLEDDRLRHALNAHLERGIVVERLETCRHDFHARFDARAKRYLYLTATTRFRPPLGELYLNWTSAALDLEAMRSAARDLVGRHDFRAFGNAGSPRRTTVRTVQRLRLIPRRRLLGFVVQADGFLYNMVRTIAGTLLDVGRGRLAPDCVRTALASGRREILGPTAPARGLYLMSALYDEVLFAGPDAGASGVPGVFQPGARARRRSTP
jgi:tRNA pseudouridine38-40 synthase